MVQTDGWCRWARTDPAPVRFHDWPSGVLTHRRLSCPLPRGQPYGRGPAVFAESPEIRRMRAWPADPRAALVHSRLIAAKVLMEAGQKPEAARARLGAVNSVYGAPPSDIMAAGLDPAMIGALRLGVENRGPRFEGLADAMAEADAFHNALRLDGGDPLELTGLPVRLGAEFFDADVSPGDIRRPPDYQTSHGLAALARRAAATLDREADGPLQTELRLPVMMWPAAGLQARAGARCSDG